MTTSARRKAFDETVPTLTDKEIDAALKAGNVTISFRGEPVMLSQNEIGFIALKFAITDGDTGVIVLDEFAARTLHGLIGKVNEADWKADKLLKPTREF